MLVPVALISLLISGAAPPKTPYAAPEPLLSVADAPTAHGGSAPNAPSIVGPVFARVAEVVDGDTVKVIADVWIGQQVAVSVRLAGVDAPELFRPKCEAEKARARAAKNFVKDFVGENAAPGAAVVKLHDVRRGKYAGRVVARITDRRGRDLAAAMTAKGFAVYGARGEWCIDGA